MDLNIVLSLGLLILTVAILRFKNMIKFVLLGLFVGWVLARVVGQDFYELLNGIDWFSGEVTLAIAKNVLLLLPAVVLGLNHFPGRSKMGLVKSLMMSFVTVLFLFASILEFLPASVREIVLDDSIVASQVVYLQLWITLLAVGMLIIDSFHHKAKIQAEKKAKKKK